MFLICNKNNEIKIRKNQKFIRILIRNEFIRKVKIGNKLYKIVIFPALNAKLYKNYLGKYILKKSVDSNVVLLRKDLQIDLKEEYILSKNEMDNFVILTVKNSIPFFMVKDFKNKRVFKINLRKKITYKELNKIKKYIRKNKIKRNIKNKNNKQGVKL